MSTFFQKIERKYHVSGGPVYKLEYKKRGKKEPATMPAGPAKITMMENGVIRGLLPAVERTFTNVDSSIANAEDYLRSLDKDMQKLMHLLKTRRSSAAGTLKKLYSAIKHYTTELDNIHAHLVHELHNLKQEFELKGIQ